METTTINEGMMALLLEEEAWKSLSDENIWNEELLTKYKDKVDWENISQNSSIYWTVPMLEKFQHRIDWKSLSRTSQKSLLSPEVVEKFENRWDWTILSGNSDLPMETIEKFANRIVWWELLDSYQHDEGFFSSEFLHKFEKYISASILKESYLWRALIEEKKQAIQKSICLG